MVKFALSFSLTLVFILGVANCSESFGEERNGKGHNNKNYDFFLLAQSWPQTSCWSLNKKWKNVDDSCTVCKIPSANRWTVHGLWPNSLTGNHPAFCNDNIIFKPNSLSSDLRDQMNNKWPTFNLQMNTDKFWSYEFKKHGTCALENGSTNTVSKYFAKTLQLIDQYNVGKILEENGIRPGGQYAVNDMYLALHKSLGTNVYIQCTKNPQTNEQYIMQVYVCFGKSFQLIDCSQNNSRISNCNSKKDVIYPKNLKTC